MGGGEEQEASASLKKKGEGREGSIKSQQKFDFFSYDGTPNILAQMSLLDALFATSNITLGKMIGSTISRTQCKLKHVCIY